MTAPTLDVKTFPTDDPRLGWVSIHDAQSLVYPVRASIATTVPDEPKFWTPSKIRLDQYREGSCVNHAWTHELMASPHPDPYVTKEKAEAHARAGYRWSQRNDEWEGEAPVYEGTSVNAGAKWVRDVLGLQTGHEWAFGIEDLRMGVSVKGPAVIGIPWLEGMYSTRPSGLVEVTGDEVGGHALCVTGYHPSMRIPGEDYWKRYRVFRWVNSWGTEYGINGTGLIRYEDLRDLLRTWGEACFPVGRKTVRLNNLELAA
jgi:hypothetical protein